MYSRTGEAYLLLANLDQAPREVTCRLRPEKLPYPLAGASVASIAAVNPPAAGERPVLDVRRLVGEGITVAIPGDGAVLIRVR